MIRKGTKDDRLAFAMMIEFMLNENYAIGGEYPPTDRNVAWLLAHFDAYESGQLPGVALLSIGLDGVPNGMLLWGSVGEPPMDTRWGRFAVGHGTYVVKDARRERIATQLREVGAAALADLGFDSVVGSAVMDNEAGIRSGLDFGGFELHGIVGVRRLA